MIDIKKAIRWGYWGDREDLDHFVIIDIPKGKTPEDTQRHAEAVKRYIIDCINTREAVHNTMKKLNESELPWKTQFIKLFKELL